MNERKRKLLLVALALLNEESSSNKRKWVRPWLTEDLRVKQECYHNLMKELALNDAEFYRRWLRMNVSVFGDLVKRITPFVQKKETSIRSCMPPEEMLAITLQYLATSML
jgi:hypothetical protein